MKKFKATLKIIGIGILLIILFRGWIFRKTVSYTPIKERKLIELKYEKLLHEIKIENKDKEFILYEMIQIARQKTNEKLSFTTEKSSSNPNEAVKLGKANCIGYSALFNSILNHLIKEQKLEMKYKAKHLVAEIAFMGIDLHQFFESAFLKDHDYNEIINLETGEKIYVDPTISDCLGIHQL